MGGLSRNQHFCVLGNLILRLLQTSMFPSSQSRQVGAQFRPVTHDVETATSNGAHKPAWAEFMIQMKFNGRERTLPLPLTPSMIKHLALEAAVRNLRMGELIRDLIISTIGSGSGASSIDAFAYGDHLARRSAST